MLTGLYHYLSYTVSETDAKRQNYPFNSNGYWLGLISSGLHSVFLRLRLFPFLYVLFFISDRPFESFILFLLLPGLSMTL
jgi:hypothetical protein